MSRVLDYTRQYWGHSLTNFSDAEGYENNEDDEVCNYTALIFSSVYPQPGDQIKYAAVGGIKYGTIYKVKPFHDPRDQFKIWFMVKDESINKAA